MEKVIRLSVRRLIEFVLRSGDIDSRFLSNRRAMEGIRLHQKLQSQYPASFQKEVLLRGQMDKGDFSIILEGRADGLYEGEDRILVDEIKSTLLKKESLIDKPNPLHWAQLKCYGWILCREKDLEEVDLRLTYVDLETEDVFPIEKTFNYQDLDDFIQEVIGRYWEIQEKINAFEKLKKASLRGLSFPFKTFRKGQRDLAVATYNMIQQGEALLAQAPTGIGKTLATLFPAIKSMDTGLTSLIFYGTGRSTHKNLAREAHRMLMDQGLRIKSTLLTAKEKICLNQKVSCNPTDCPYAKGHYDRVLAALLDAYENEDIFDLEVIQDLAQTHMVCPFELQLDLSDYSHLIIGDYNYVFHPKSHLERLMSDTKRMKEAVLLIDEAHNLVDRGRDMYSTDLSSDLILRALEYGRPSKALKKKILDLEEALVQVLDKGQRAYESMPENLEAAMEAFRFSMDISLSKTKTEPEEDLMNLYFQVIQWQDLMIYFDPKEFVIYVGQEAHKVSLLCLDTSTVLNLVQRKFASKVYFSATLQPFDYHGYLLGLGQEARYMDLPSPFDPENFLILHPSQIGTSYKERQASLETLSQYLKILGQSHQGNYLFFFPSYAYLDQVYQANQAWEEEAHLQERSMTEEERQAYIQAFYQREGLHGYAVMGGVFSEGIDLKGRALEGAAIVSLALPGLSPERDLIKRTFNKRGLPGFDYAYTIPGLIKVLQSAGRIIRDEEDRGVLVLFDRRFSQEKIRSVLPRHWQIKEVKTQDQYKKYLEEFWR